MATDRKVLADEIERRVAIGARVQIGSLVAANLSTILAALRSAADAEAMRDRAIKAIEAVCDAAGDPETGSDPEVGMNASDILRTWLDRDLCLEAIRNLSLTKAPESEHG